MEDIVTIDGPTSSGKNSVGFLLAQKLGYQYIDTGMIYRALTFTMHKEAVSPDDLDRILQIFHDMDIKFENNGSWKMYLNGEDVTDKLHKPEISVLVPIVSAIREVREAVKEKQKELAKDGRVVIGGRDIGSEIFPEAKFKFWLTALVEKRAARRFKQLVAKNSAIKFEDVLEDMKARDKHDAERVASPMRIPQGAITIDNSNMTIEKTVEEMLKTINA